MRAVEGLGDLAITGKYGSRVEEVQTLYTKGRGAMKGKRFGCRPQKIHNTTSMYVQNKCRDQPRPTVILVFQSLQ